MCGPFAVVVETHTIAAAVAIPAAKISALENGRRRAFRRSLWFALGNENRER